jgi:hypothetical protein
MSITCGGTDRLGGALSVEGGIGRETIDVEARYHFATGFVALAAIAVFALPPGAEHHRVVAGVD